MSDVSRQHGPSAAADRSGPAADVFLLGEVDFGACLLLQQRLVYECGGRRDGKIFLLICEHRPEITVGRQGSWRHIHLDRPELASRQVDVRWLARGGGCVAHGPGQLAIYPIVPLEPLGLTVGGYMQRLQAALLAVCRELGVKPIDRPGRHGVWGRSGQLAVCGVAVKNSVTHHGAFLNVAPSMRLARRVDHDPVEQTPISSLVAERQQPVKMNRVRELVIRHLTAALDQPRFHLFTGHPLLAAGRLPANRAG
ncbi:MAG: lipoyl(octanoyl) transferase LipB [Pirellulales bacterium]